MSTLSVKFSPAAVYTFTLPLPLQFVSALCITARSQFFATKLIAPLPPVAKDPGGIEPDAAPQTVPCRTLIPPVQVLPELRR